MKWARWQIPILFFLMLYLVVSAVAAWVPEPAGGTTPLAELAQPVPTAHYTLSPRLAAWIVLPTNTPHPQPSATRVVAQAATHVEPAASTATSIPASESDSASLTAGYGPPVPTQSLTPSPVSSPEPTATTEPTLLTHLIESGDTLSGIAKEYGVTVLALVEANQLANPDVLRIGQVLTIPIPQPALPTDTPTP